MSIEFFLTILVAAIFCVLFYLAADTIYAFHYKLKRNGNPLSKLITSDVKNLVDKEKWVRRYRAKTTFLLFVILATPIFRFFVI